MQSMLMLLIVLGCISTVSTTKCYRCTSTDSKNDCGDSFDASLMTDANKIDDKDNDGCWKEVTRSTGGVQIKRDVRGPKFSCIGGLDGCDDYNDLGKTVTVCCCKGDFCNGASTLHQPLLTIFFLIISTFAMFIYRHF